MRRVFWAALGAAAGVLVVRRLSRAANRWTPQGLAGRTSGLGERARALWDEVQAAAAEREAELRSALGLDGQHDVVDVHTLDGRRGENPVSGRRPVGDDR